MQSEGLREGSRRCELEARGKAREEAGSAWGGVRSAGGTVGTGTCRVFVHRTASQRLALGCSLGWLFPEGPWFGAEKGVSTSLLPAEHLPLLSSLGGRKVCS